MQTLARLACSQEPARPARQAPPPLAASGDTEPRSAPLIPEARSLTVVRMVPVAIALRGTGAQLPTVAFMGWFGPRGLASIVFALVALEKHIPDQQMLLTTVMMTILLSVFLHGLSSVPLVAAYSPWYAARPDTPMLPKPSRRSCPGRGITRRRNRPNRRSQNRRPPSKAHRSDSRARVQARTEASPVSAITLKRGDSQSPHLNTRRRHGQEPGSWMAGFSSTWRAVTGPEAGWSPGHRSRKGPMREQRTWTASRHAGS